MAVVTPFTTVAAPATVTALPARPALDAARLAARVVFWFDVLALALALTVSGATATPIGFAYFGLALVTLAASDAYRLRMTLSALDAAPWLVSRLAIPLLLLVPVALPTGLSRDVLAEVVLAMGLVVGGRGVSYALARRARRHGRLAEPAVILGAGEIGVDLARAFREHPELGIAPVGFLDNVSGPLPLPLLGDVDSLEALLEGRDIRHVVVAFGPVREAELVGVLRTAVRHELEVHIVPRFFDCGVAPEGPDTDTVRGIPLYRVRRAALRDGSWHLKRVVDIVAASSALLVASPLLAAAAVGVKLTSPGPVLFRQRRVGQDGHEFEVLKLRTMRVNDDSDVRWSVAGDDRTTPLGGWLRRTSIDELPQLWNVLRGDMSLVGPRPERPYFVERFSLDVDGYRDRHRLPVGLTGWAQVHGLRGDTSIEERARLDNQYIEHWSIWRDVVILARTAAEVTRSARGPSR